MTQQHMHLLDVSSFEGYDVFLYATTFGATVLFKDKKDDEYRVALKFLPDNKRQTSTVERLTQEMQDFAIALYNSRKDELSRYTQKLQQGEIG